MRNELAASIASIVRELFGLSVDVELTRPDEQFGDYASNVAMQIASKAAKEPKAIAAIIRDKLLDQFGYELDDITVIAPGFLNIRLGSELLSRGVTEEAAKPLQGKTVVAEYSDPNPFKVLHAGHLYTSIIGDGIANLLENAGAKVYRVNFGGDVGLHVAKNIWAILKTTSDNPDKLADIKPDERADWLSQRYVEGSQAYENDDTAKAEITELNQQIYKLVNDSDHDSNLAQIYWTARAWSYQYFDDFYASIGSHFDKYYPESETAPIGLEAVEKHPEVFTQSDGAVIFDGEKFGLHRRVFVTGQGLPTYETKDMGATLAKYNDYSYDQQIIITGNDIIEYMKVVLKAIEQFESKPARTTKHLTHGIVKLAGGKKMSSRKGNVLRAVDVLEAADEAYRSLYDKTDKNVSLAAVKYAFLKQRLGGDIIYNPKESVSLEGNSGPYLQYAHARAKSILSKVKTKNPTSQNIEFVADERSLARKISEYSEVVELATDTLMPHHVCTYLYELAQEFNRFYENNRVVGHERESTRVQLVTYYANRLKSGLELLGIAAPDKM